MRSRDMQTPEVAPQPWPSQIPLWQSAAAAHVSPSAFAVVPPLPPPDPASGSGSTGVGSVGGVDRGGGDGHAATASAATMHSSFGIEVIVIACFISVS